MHIPCYVYRDKSIIDHVKPWSIMYSFAINENHWVNWLSGETLLYLIFICIPQQWLCSLYQSACCFLIKASGRNISLNIFLLDKLFACLQTRAYQLIYYRVYKLDFRKKSWRLIQSCFPTYISCYKYIYKFWWKQYRFKDKWSSIILIEIFYENI